MLLQPILHARAALSLRHDSCDHHSTSGLFRSSFTPIRTHPHQHIHEAHGAQYTLATCARRETWVFSVREGWPGAWSAGARLMKEGLQWCCDPMCCPHSTTARTLGRQRWRIVATSPPSTPKDLQLTLTCPPTLTRQCSARSASLLLERCARVRKRESGSRKMVEIEERDSLDLTLVTQATCDRLCHYWRFVAPYAQNQRISNHLPHPPKAHTQILFSEHHPGCILYSTCTHVFHEHVHMHDRIRTNAGAQACMKLTWLIQRILLTHA